MSQACQRAALINAPPTMPMMMRMGVLEHKGLREDGGILLGFELRGFSRLREGRAGVGRGRGALPDGRGTRGFYWSWNCLVVERRVRDSRIFYEALGGMAGAVEVLRRRATFLRKCLVGEWHSGWHLGDLIGGRAVPGDVEGVGVSFRGLFDGAEVEGGEKQESEADSMMAAEEFPIRRPAECGGRSCQKFFALGEVHGEDLRVLVLVLGRGGCRGGGDRYWGRWRTRRGGPSFWSEGDYLKVRVSSGSRIRSGEAGMEE